MCLQEAAKLGKGIVKSTVAESDNRYGISPASGYGI